MKGEISDHFRMQELRIKQDGLGLQLMGMETIPYNCNQPVEASVRHYVARMPILYIMNKVSFQYVKST